MLKISLYHDFCVALHAHINPYRYRKDQSNRVNSLPTSAIGARLSGRQKPCFPYALPCRPFEIIRTDIESRWRTDGNDTHIGQFMGETLRIGRHQRLGDPSRPWAQTHNGLLGRRGRKNCHRERQAKCKESQGSLAAGYGQRSLGEYVQGFFIRIGARYRRIRKRPKGSPSPQLYAHKTEKLQELERQANEGRIDLYFGDESHVCTEGYVPYGWQFRGEDVFVPSQKILRLNIFGMIDRDNHYEGFSTTESITADKLADFLDQLSFRIRKETFLVLDNAKIHRCKLISELRPVWEKRGLFLFFLPPYSPHLNIAETLWRILKGKWLRPADYMSTDAMLYATNRALAAIGTELYINFAHAA